MSKYDRPRNKALAQCSRCGTDITWLGMPMNEEELKKVVCGGCWLANACK